MIRLKKSIAFTLAEVLLSLSILGVVSALTIPSVLHTNEIRANAALLKKAVTKLDEVVQMASIEPEFQPLNCHYWEPNQNRSGCTTEKIYDSTGKKSWKTTCPENTPSGMNTNGYFADCAKLYEYTLNNLKVVKSCNEAVKEGCAPKYKSNDEKYKDENPQGDTSDDEYNTKVYNETAGCSAFQRGYLEKRPSFVTNDGMIFMAYDKGTPIYAIDVNGKRGPNKMGYDVFFLQLRGDLGYSPSFRPGGCEYIEPGGKKTAEMLKGKY